MSGTKRKGNDMAWCSEHDCPDSVCDEFVHSGAGCVDCDYHAHSNERDKAMYRALRGPIMAWGLGGEEVRDKMKTELAMVRQPMYRMKQAAETLKHPEKGPQLRSFVDEVYATLDKIEATLRR